MPRPTDIIWLEKTDSTNLELRRRISDIDNLSVLCAVEQTAGRGQGDHTWTSTPGENLTCSVLLRFEDIAPLRATDALYITKIITLAIVDYLAGLDIRARIKWHNDIYVDGLKICGILIENILEGEFVSESIVGIGLNVNQTIFPAELPNPVSIASLKGGRYDVKEVARALREKIVRRAGMLSIADGRNKLTEEFDSLVFRLP